MPLYISLSLIISQSVTDNILEDVNMFFHSCSFFMWSYPTRPEASLVCKSITTTHHYSYGRNSKRKSQYQFLTLKIYSSFIHPFKNTSLIMSQLVFCLWVYNAVIPWECRLHKGRDHMCVFVRHIGIPSILLNEGINE